MTDEKKAQLIRNSVMVLVFVSAITLGYFVDFPVLNLEKESKEEVAEREEKEKEIRGELAVENRLTVLNTMVDGNPDSKKLKKILEKLKQEKYGDQVEAVDFDAELQKVLADEHGIDLEEFAGQLDFYSGGQKLGTLKGETDPAVVEQTIAHYLAGLVKRFGPGWLPDVNGLQRRKTIAPTPVGGSQQTSPSGVPGMERVVSGVPGMTRAKSGQNHLKVEPAEKPKE